MRVLLCLVVPLFPITSEALSQLIAFLNYQVSKHKKEGKIPYNFPYHFLQLSPTKLMQAFQFPLNIYLSNIRHPININIKKKVESKEEILKKSAVYKNQQNAQVTFEGLLFPVCKTEQILISLQHVSHSQFEHTILNLHYIQDDNESSSFYC